jgi:tRNA dimethylallyltransferase
MEVSEIVKSAKSKIENFRSQHPKGIVVIRWTTATGKTKLSLLLSEYFELEIISADSRQIFCQMNIGTDKISSEIRKNVPHHQIDIINPEQNYSAGQRKKDTESIIEQIQKKWKLPMIVWWTGLYIDSILKNFSLPECPPMPAFREEMFAREEKDPGYLRRELSKIDPKEAAKNNPKSTRYLVRALEIYESLGIPKSLACQEQEVKYPILMLGLRREKDSTNQLIDQRISEMIKNWLVEEVKWLLKKWYSKSLQSMQGIWYKQTIEYLEWITNFEKFQQKLQEASHRLAKRQRTRFRRYLHEAQNSPRKNVEYHVFEL